MASRTFRAFVAVAALSLAAAGCTAETGSEGPAPEAKGATAEGNVTLWHFFSGREAEAIQAVVDDFEKANPKITVDVRSEQDDEKVRQAIAAGKGPDLGISYSTAIVGSFCSTGAFIDLEPWMERDGVSADIFPDLVSDYTEFDGTRCAMPMLADAYGLYYNKKMLADAGFDGPPKTAEELTEMAKALTVRNPDGSIKVAGFVPTFGFYENTPEVMAPAWGAQWLDDDLDPQIADDPAWADLLEWQKELVEAHRSLRSLAPHTETSGKRSVRSQGQLSPPIPLVIDGRFSRICGASSEPHGYSHTALIWTGPDTGRWMV